MIGHRSSGGAERIQTAMLLAMPSSNRISSGRSFEGGLALEAFAVPESQSDAVAEGIEKVVLAVAGSVANAKALDLGEQVVS